MNVKPKAKKARIIEILDQETKKLGIDFIYHYGFREFYLDGTTLGVSSNEDWNKTTLDRLFKTEMEKHYLSELTNAINDIINNGISHVIRNREQGVSEFQNKLLHLGLSNSLIIYKRIDNLIRGYYFINYPQDHKLLQFFINNFSLFHRITNLTDYIISRDHTIIEELLPQKFHLFPEKAIYKIINQKKDLVPNLKDINNNFNSGEKKILDILQKSVKQMKLSFITNVGYRVFLNNGNSFGICTNKTWKEEKKSLRYQTLFKHFYTNELLRMKRNDHSFSIRVQGQAQNEFLKITSNYGLGNVLAICKFSETQICAYYFLAEGSNYNATNDFCNNLQILQEIVNNNHTIINQLVELNLMKDFSQELLPSYAIKELFITKEDNNQPKDTLLKKNNLFTKKQCELLSLLASGVTSYKAISFKMGTVPKTVGWHIMELKKKINVSTKKELISFAKKITV